MVKSKEIHFTEALPDSLFYSKELINNYVGVTFPLKIVTQFHFNFNVKTLFEAKERLICSSNLIASPSDANNWNRQENDREKEKKKR